jgi:hypothetical protein
MAPTVGFVMRRYYFVNRELSSISGTCFEHPEGTVLEDDKAARFYAMRLVRQLNEKDPDGFRGWTLDVLEHERLVCSIPFHKGN